MHICVVGAGIIGTTSAVRIKKAFPHVRLTLISETFSPNTTGDGAAGFWQPHLDPHTPKHKVRKWALGTFQLCEQLWRRDFDTCTELQDLWEMGAAVSLMPAYDLLDDFHDRDDGQAVDNPWKELVYDYRWLDKLEASRLGFPANAVGHAFTSYTFEASLALPAMYKWLRQQNDVTFVERRLDKLVDHILDDYDLVINCSGVGAKFLANDNNIIPISGHVLRVEAPWVHYTIAKGSETYIIPNRNSLVVGSVNRFNNWNTTPRSGDASRILQRCADQLCPSLRDARIIGEWVGLRPYRIGGVRLEMEKIHVGNRHINVIHNYGHGGSGVTLSWGCALEVVQLAKEHFSKLPAHL